MRLALRATVVTCLVASAIAAIAPPPGGVEATFPDARARDDLLGVLTANDTDVRVELTAPAGSALSATLTPDDTVSGAATGVGLQLYGPDEQEVVVVGTKADKTKAGKDAVKWKKAPLAAFGTYTLAVSADTPGGFRLKLSIKDAKLKQADASDQDLPVDGTATVAFDGRAGDTAKINVRPGRKSKLRGTILSVKRPGGSDVFPESDGAKWKLLLDEDGRYTVTFRNDGKDPGAWDVRTQVKPRKSKKRNALVSAAQTGLVPRVKKLDPDTGVHLDTALRLTIAGRDFQSGADVRLERKGRAPIIATDVDVVSPTEITCTVDLDTRPRDAGENSVGKWRVAVRNAPLFGDAQDPTTIDTDSPLVDASKALKSVSTGSVKLPDGVEDGAEVWHVVFNDDFQVDLSRLGLSSEILATRDAARDAVEDYVIAYLRDLFLVQETNGNVKGAAVPVSFVQDEVTRIAGEPGLDFNQVIVGGEMPEDAPTDPSEPLPWGFAAFDQGNAQRDIVTVYTDVLDPRGGNPWASSSFRQAVQPLRDIALGRIDLAFFEGRFDPGDPIQAERFADIVTQIERVAREIAAMVAHQVGKAMGLPGLGQGPMASPSSSGAMWVDRDSLAFSGPQLETLRANAVDSDLPGNSDGLQITFFPIIDRQPAFLPDMTTGIAYDAPWDFVGGRCNAVPSDYRVSLSRGSNALPGLALSYDGIAGTAPVCLDGGCANINAVYCGVATIGVRVDDTLRGSGSLLVHRLRIVPDINQFPPGHPLRNGVQSCINQVLATQ